MQSILKEHSLFWKWCQQLERGRSIPEDVEESSDEDVKIQQPICDAKII